MTKITVKIEGMMCGMCEAHINDAIRTAFSPKKVTCSHTKNQSVIISENDIDDALLKAVIGKMGYTFVSAKHEPCVKRGLFGWK